LRSSSLPSVREFYNQIQIRDNQKEYLEFYHRTDSVDKIISLRVYQGKLFLNISVSKDRKLSFVIFPSEQRNIRNYLRYVIERRYQIQDTLKHLEYMSAK